MKIEYLKDYVDDQLGKGRKGATDYVTIALGKKLIKQGLAKQVKEERIQAKASSKDAPIREPEKIELPEEAVPQPKIEQPPKKEKKKPLWAKILKL